MKKKEIALKIYIFFYSEKIKEPLFLKKSICLDQLWNNKVAFALKNLDKSHFFCFDIHEKYAVHSFYVINKAPTIYINELIKDLCIKFFHLKDRLREDFLYTQDYKSDH